MTGFRSFVETDAFTDPIDDVKLIGTGRKLVYPFHVGGKEYKVIFDDYGQLEIGGVVLANSHWKIDLKGPNQYNSTGYGTPFSVYNFLIKAVRKFFEQVNPEALLFSGAEPGQEVMYDRFYRSHLQSAYTRITGEHYVRNDILENWRRSNDDRWPLVHGLMTKLAGDDPVGKARQLKNEERAKRMSLGKIVLVPKHNAVAYVSKASPTFEISGFFNGKYYENLTFGHQHIMPFDQQTASNMEQHIRQLQQHLAAHGVRAEPWMSNRPAA